MSRSIRFGFAVTALVLAVLLPTFYLDYKAGVVAPNKRAFLLSWTASQEARDQFVTDFASRSETPSSMRYDGIERVGDKSYRAKKVFVPGITREQGIMMAEEFLKTNTVREGLTPSHNTSDPNNISQAAMSRAFWLGLVVPLLLFTAAVVALLRK